MTLGSSSPRKTKNKKTDPRKTDLFISYDSWRKPVKKIELSEHFTKRKILIYSLPSIFETFATTSFQMVDGYFVSNLLGLQPYVAVGLISPVFFLLYALGFMFGEGASALIAQIMGDGDKERGNKIFTMTTVVMLIFGVVVGIAAALLMPTLARLVGASDSAFGYAVEYGRLLVFFLPMYLVNSAFASLWITAEKGWYGMIVAAINGLGNVALDWLFMGPLQMGVDGAALATSLSAVIAAAITLFYFARPNESSLRFTRFSLKDLKALLQICINGASSMVDSIAGNLTVLLMNSQLIRYMGEIGVAAMEVYDYVVEFFLAILFGISTTSVTIVGYKYGEKNRKELDGLAKDGITLTLALGVALCFLFYLCAELIARIYVGYDEETFLLTVHAIRILSLSCIIIGFSLFVSSFFTGLGNGLVSGLLSLVGSLVAPIAMMYALPALFGGDALWFSPFAATLITGLFCAIMLITQYYRKKNIW